jgi:methylated-DNA-[protein]-cysteine S-methyltransferase
MNKNNLIKQLDNYNLTKFQKEVLIATLSIKKGETRTYKQIAIQINHKNAYRAVGTALKNNPLPIKIPCHRVIKSDGSVGLYDGKNTGIKLKLLKSEGALSQIN